MVLNLGCMMESWITKKRALVTVLTNPSLALSGSVLASVTCPLQSPSIPELKDSWENTSATCNQNYTKLWGACRTDSSQTGAIVKAGKAALWSRRHYFMRTREPSPSP